MLANKALSAAPSAVPVYVEDVFSTYLWEGNATARNIVNGIDLAGKGGLVWTKYRNITNNHRLYDTARGATKEIYSSLTNAESTASQSLTAFNADGFSLGTGQPNENTATVVGWTFRKQEKFFDVVTYTGNGSNRTISHSLGSTPGCIIIKRTDTSGYAWCVYHRALGTPASNFLFLNTTDGTQTGTVIWNNTAPTSTVFSLGNYSDVNANGGTYVAYLFAHDAGGFGASGSDNVISCGSWTGSTSSVNINLGYEPQWLLIRRTDDAADWFIFDVMRQMSYSNVAGLNPNAANAEALQGAGYFQPTPTGFTVRNGWSTSGSNWIYIAIRRGPMKTPTSGTSIYEGTVRTGTGATASITGLSFPPDFVITRNRPANLNSNWAFFDKLRGTTKYLSSNATTAETTGATSLTSFNQAGETFGDSGIVNGNGDSYINYQMRRAPGFFDEVCYTGSNSTNLRVTHNLGVAPDLIIVKSRESITSWPVYVSSEGRSKYMYLNSTQASTAYTDAWGTSNPTTTDFGINATDFGAGFRSGGQVAYLFASVTGVSKVGSYTGNGSSQTINCGFTGGARFVLIKRTDSTGDWVVFDSARGIVAGNDPYLELNTSDAEVTDKDAVDTDNSGFVVNETTGPNVNTNGATYIYFSVA